METATRQRLHPLYSICREPGSSIFFDVCNQSRDCDSAPAGILAVRSPKSCVISPMYCNLGIETSVRSAFSDQKVHPSVRLPQRPSATTEPCDGEDTTWRIQNPTLTGTKVLGLHVAVGDSYCRVKCEQGIQMHLGLPCCTARVEL
ncbi:hypothetical protein AAC387_Pa05g1692 [Persea americana]